MKKIISFLLITQCFISVAIEGQNGTGRGQGWASKGRGQSDFVSSVGRGIGSQTPEVSTYQTAEASTQTERSVGRFFFGRNRGRGNTAFAYAQSQREKKNRK